MPRPNCHFGVPMNLISSCTEPNTAELDTFFLLAPPLSSKAIKMDNKQARLKKIVEFAFPIDACLTKNDFFQRLDDCRELSASDKPTIRRSKTPKISNEHEGYNEKETNIMLRI